MDFLNDIHNSFGHEGFVLVCIGVTVGAFILLNLYMDRKRRGE